KQQEPPSTTVSSTTLSTPLPVHLYQFKLLDPHTSRPHRFTSPFATLHALRLSVATRLGVADPRDVGLAYRDDEGDVMGLDEDGDLVDAVAMAREGGWGMVRLVVEVEEGTVRRPRKERRRGEEGRKERGMVPVLMGSGVALACAFLLGRAFK
ncbi:hypothetical protein HKX48_000158, partial [Thoreauomyces humboldtii]